MDGWMGGWMGGWVDIDVSKIAVACGEGKCVNNITIIMSDVA